LKGGITLNRVDVAGPAREFGALRITTGVRGLMFVGIMAAPP
jgi:hypothetical protein